MNPCIELQGKFLPVRPGREFGERHHGAHVHRDGRAYEASQFGNHQRQPGGHAVTAHKMKERAVLALEINRKHGRLRLLDQPGVKVPQGSSSALPAGCSAVATPPAGNTTIVTPLRNRRRAALRDSTFVLIASRFSEKSIGSAKWRISGTFRKALWTRMRKGRPSCSARANIAIPSPMPNG